MTAQLQLQHQNMFALLEMGRFSAVRCSPSALQWPVFPLISCPCLTGVLLLRIDVLQWLAPAYPMFARHNMLYQMP
jgi:hypothetical protein